ncbi:MAG: sulfotransferase family 2 domain-containing protein [Phycisphaerales bacterium]
MTLPPLPTLAEGSPDVLNAVVDLIAYWKQYPSDVQQSRNRDTLDRLCVSFDQLREHPVPYGSCEDQRLMFLHVPKAGGTTFEHVLARNYEMNNVLHLNAPVFERNPVALYKKLIFPTVVMGHHALHHPLYQCIPGNIVHVTLLRDPVARVLSYFRYLKSDVEHALHPRVRDLSLDAFLDLDNLPEISNGQTLRLSGWTYKQLRSAGNSANACLNDALANVHRRFTLVGLVERFTEFILLLQRLLGWTDPFTPRKNQSAMTDVAISQSHIDQIAAMNALDQALYAEASTLFDARVQALGVTAGHVRDYETWNDTIIAMLENARKAALQ